MKRIAVNVLFLIPYLVAVSTDQPPAWALVAVLLWGFKGFRWLLDGFWHLTGLIVIASLRQWGVAFIIGSLLCSAFGIVLIPILIVIQLRQLSRIPKSV